MLAKSFISPRLVPSRSKLSCSNFQNSIAFLLRAVITSDVKEAKYVVMARETAKSNTLIALVVGFMYFG